MRHVFTIPPDAGFLTALVRAVLAGGFPGPDRPPPGPEDLARWTFLVPNRRSARLLQHTFLTCCGRPVLLLPAIRPIGDIDEDLFDGAGDGVFTPGLPEAISPAGRDFLLVHLIGQWAASHPHEPLAREIAGSARQTLALAQSLGQLADRFETGDVPFDALSLLTGRELAAHRESILTFLDILNRDLPAALKARGLIGPAARRSRLIDLAAAQLKAHPPRGPVIAAGSTGSIPATARLIAAVAALDEGAVVLPGLDQDMDDQTWAAVDDSHPQVNLKQLLDTLEIGRDQVRLLPGLERSAAGRARTWLASEVMRPAAVSEGWGPALAARTGEASAALSGLIAIEAQSQHEEAATIALMMRETLEQPGATAALVTADRTLARKVKAELLRWGVTAGDSAGEPLMRTTEAALLAAVADHAAGSSTALETAALIGHPLVTLGRTGPEARSAARYFEIAVLRRNFPLGHGLAGAARHARVSARDDPHLHAAARALDDDAWDALTSFASAMDAAIAPLDEAPGPALLSTHLTTLTNVAEALAGPPLWLSAGGAAVREVIDRLASQSAILGDTSFADAAAYLMDYLRATPLRQPAGPGQRLHIYGLLEARLIEVDRLVLGGLSAKSWPPQPDPGPWLNRPMRTALSLQQPERQIGLAAHDFVQAFAKPGAVLTWPRRVDNEPVVPSRFVLRLQAVAAAANVQLSGSNWQDWVRELDRPQKVAPVAAPRPTPPAAGRLKRLSVSDVERLIRDPYAVYAQRILGLRPLDPLRNEADASLRGQLIHEVLHRYALRYPTGIPAGPGGDLLEIGRQVFAPHLAEPDVAAFWWPRFVKMAQWFSEQDQLLRDGISRIAAECTGRLSFEIAGAPFELSGRADRIDLLADGGARIIDYKTGAPPSKPQVTSGLAPQLPLEGAILAQGGFRDIAAVAPLQLLYLRLTGGDKPGELIPVAEGDEAVALCAQQLGKLKGLLAEYAAPTQPFHPRAVMFKDREESPYDRLSRYAEWSRSGDEA